MKGLGVWDLHSDRWQSPKDVTTKINGYFRFKAIVFLNPQIEVNQVLKKLLHKDIWQPLVALHIFTRETMAKVHDVSHLLPGK